jgi:hypothetical protein
MILFENEHEREHGRVETKTDGMREDWDAELQCHEKILEFHTLKK